MIKKIIDLILFSLLFVTSIAHAKTGLLFNISESGTPVSADIILCLNGKGPISCQRYHVSAQNLNIRATLNHNYPVAGIKVLTPGFTVSGCAPYPNGYCLFEVSSSAIATVVLNNTRVPKSVPDSPTGVTAGIGNASALIRWTAPLNDGGTSILSYKATASNGNSCTVAAPTTQCRVTGLTNGDSYTLTVTATNAVGTSVPSATSTPVTPAIMNVLASFDVNTGFFSPGQTYPWGALIQAIDGDLYGIAPFGGTNGVGTIFKFSLTNNSLTVLVNFDSSIGNSPYGRLLQTSDSTFYGGVSTGGTNNLGAIYKFSLADNTLTLLDSFTSTTGSGPRSGLLKASDGDFYGVTVNGGANGFGTVYKFSPVSNTISLVAAMTSATANPLGDLIQTSDGNLYGTGFLGGNSGRGSLFRVTIPGNVLVSLANFDTSIGELPIPGLMEAPDGYLYGVTTYGGVNSAGSIYRILPTGNSIEILNSLESTSTGNQTFSALVQASDGFLYGTAFTGGANNGGTIFKYDPVGGTLTNVFSFDATTGTYPYGSLLLASDQNFYGTTSGNGSGSLGSLFVLYAPFS